MQEVRLEELKCSKMKIFVRVYGVDKVYSEERSH